MPDWPQTPTLLQEVDHLRSELRAEQEGNLLLQENLADLQLALEDRGWRAINAQVELDFTPAGRKALRSLCRSMAIANPLLKRGLGLRIGYIWGQGVEVRARAAGAEQAQDVNAVVQGFWDANASTLSDAQALEDHERGIATEGDRFLTCFTNPLTGSVRIRTALADEVVDIITNPDDRDEPWFYVRNIPQKVVEPGLAANTTRTRSQVLKVLHPAVGYWPMIRPKSIDGAPVRWDAPILHVKVNSPTGWRFGIPDVYASVAWARAYKEFLVDWAQLTKALSKIAWQATGGTKSKAQNIAAKLTADRAAQSGSIGPIPPVGSAGASDAGATVASTPDVRLEAVSKSGATIDANSGKPLAGMAAAGLGVPVTMLLADPGITGARAVAETLDLPTVLEMGMRRLTWQGYLTKLLNYVIDQAALAPRGALRGSLLRDEWGQLQVQLAGNVERTLEWEWPPLAEVDPIQLVKAIVEADSTTVGQAVPLVMLRLLLNALGVKDVDEILEGVSDDEGHFIDPAVTAGDAAAAAFRRGEDPAAALA